MYKSRQLLNTRIDVADALRGIAVAGIILYHSVEHFDIFTEKPILHTLSCDQTVASVLAWLLSGKMYGIFAMLFGLSFFIMNDSLQRHIRGIKCRFRPSGKRQGGKNGPIVYDLVGDAKVDWVPLYKKGQT